MNDGSTTLARAARAATLALAAAASSGCGDECLAYDYSPASARLQIRDAATGESICTAADFSVTTDRGPAIAHEDTCDWWLPEWAPVDDPLATQSELVVTVTGYQPQPIAIPIARNECGEIQRPAPVLVDVQPAAAE
jgi:hypothetical protein